MALRGTFLKVSLGAILSAAAGILALLGAAYYWKLQIPDFVVSKNVWHAAEGFLSSVFFTSVVGALAGAFAGAYGGQLIVERGKARDQLLAEIRNTNSAITIAFSVCNTLLSLKGQHLKRLKEEYDDQRREVVR